MAVEWEDRVKIGSTMPSKKRVAQKNWGFNDERIFTILCIAGFALLADAATAALAMGMWGDAVAHARFGWVSAMVDISLLFALSCLCSMVASLFPTRGQHGRGAGGVTTLMMMAIAIILTCIGHSARHASMPLYVSIRPLGVFAVLALSATVIGQQSLDPAHGIGFSSIVGTLCWIYPLNWSTIYPAVRQLFPQTLLGLTLMLAALGMLGWVSSCAWTTQRHMSAQQSKRGKKGYMIQERSRQDELPFEPTGHNRRESARIRARGAQDSSSGYPSTDENTTAPSEMADSAGRSNSGAVRRYTLEALRRPEHASASD